MTASSSESTSATSPTTSSSFQQINGLSEISSTHTLFLLDMWGVMHNGNNPYDGVLECISNLKKQDEDKKLIILSNSSKRKSNALKMLKKLGFQEEDFEDVITSGEISHRMLSGDTTLQCTQWPILAELQSSSSAKKVFVFGSGDEDEEYCTSAGWTLSSIDEADLILARGTFTINDGSSVVSKKENEEKYFQHMEKMLAEAAKKNIPMLVSNPDKIRPDADLSPMPGAIGDAYYDALLSRQQTNGGSDSDLDIIKRIGKPYPEVYEIALNEVREKLHREEIQCCMVGDALETDIVGGLDNDCSTCWVINDGIHSGDVNTLGEGDMRKGADLVMEKFNVKNTNTAGEKGNVVPSFVIPHFRW